MSRRRWCRTAAILLVGAIAAAGAGSHVLQGAVPPQQPAAEISPQALAQIDALLQEKASWSPAQRKIDSQLLLPVKRARNAPIAAGAPVLLSAMEIAGDGRIEIVVRANVTDQLLATVRSLGADVISAHPAYHDIQLRVTPAQVEAVAALQDVFFIQPKQDVLTQGTSVRRTDRRADRSAVRQNLLKALQSRSGVLTNTGAVTTSEGAATHRAAEARAAFPGGDGTGVKIGVLSNGVIDFDLSQESGDLPPTCATPSQPGSCLTIMPGQAGPATTGSAEGTAMLEIVHDLAPGAKLFFATGVTGLSTFAQNIRDLRFVAGCDIIVDDIGYAVETPFQDGQGAGIISTTNGGVIIQAVKDVVADGAMYFASAANSGNFNDGTSGTWEGDFADGGGTSAPLATGGRVHSFGAHTYNVLTLPGNANNLFWSDPLGASSNDYDLFRLNNAGTIVLAASINVQNGTQDPYEQIAAGNTNDLLVIVKYSGSARFLRLGTVRGRLQIATPGETHGHSATSAPNSFGVAASAALAPGPNPNPFNASNVVELFSSDGPRRIFFNSGGQPLSPGNVGATGGQVLNKPDFTAADRVSVTGNGGFPSVFTGTSAAAPHAAAIAALIKSRNLAQTADDVRAILIASAIDIEAPGPDRDSGAGIIMALTTAAGGATAPSITTQPPSQSIAINTSATLRVVATGTGPLSFQWFQGTSPDISTPIGGAMSPQFTTSALAVDTNFWVRVSGVGSPADSATAQIAIEPSSPPTIGEQPPQEIGVLSGQSASIGVGASGIGLTYQWFQGDSGDTSNPIGGATGAGFATGPLTVETHYWVRVTNAAGFVNSTTSKILVGAGPNISGQPASQTVSCGQPVALSVAASGSGTLTFQWYAGVSGDRSNPIAGAISSSFTSPALGASAAFWVRVSNLFDAVSSSTATIAVNASGNCLQAIYDTTLKAPKCAVAGSVCDAGNLLVGRDTIVGGVEPNQPNTIHDSCPDGSQGIFHFDESIDGLRISTVDGSRIAPGKTVRVEATVWAFDPDSDRLDLYSAPDATNPVWTFVTTLVPLADRAQTLSATYTLPVGRLQAVRAVFRFGGTPSPCTPGDPDDSFDDRDDLIFAAGDMIANGDFSAGLSNWSLFEVPDIVHNNGAGGELEFHLANPTTTPSGQAVVFQETGLTVPTATPLLASFALANEEAARKRITVIIGDKDFTDMSVCTFWLPPSAPVRTYQMKTHPTKDLANATINFYAASTGTGDYRLDDVSMTYDAAGSSTRTDCLDPTAPAPAGSAGTNLLVNGGFNGGLAPWQTFFNIVGQVSGGVFEFIRPDLPGVPGGGVFQSTNQPMVTGQVVTSSFQLGNSSIVRKRVTVLMHDLDFNDLSACTFWMAPLQPLSTYTMRSFATKPWTNATLTVYAPTIGVEQWSRVDNVTFQRSTTSVLGTECIEPTVLGVEPPSDDGSGGGLPARSAAGGVGSNAAGSGWNSTDATGWRSEARTDGVSVLQPLTAIDLTHTTSAHVLFQSWLSSRGSSGSIQVSVDGANWQTVASVPHTEGWTSVEVDLSEFGGQIVFVRFVFDEEAPSFGVSPDFWLIDDIKVLLDGPLNALLNRAIL